jgi:hypothetical protein
VAEGPSTRVRTGDFFGFSEFCCSKNLCKIFYRKSFSHLLIINVFKKMYKKTVSKKTSAKSFFSKILLLFLSNCLFSKVFRKKFC